MQLGHRFFFTISQAQLDTIYKFHSNIWSRLKIIGTTPPKLEGSSLAVCGSCIYFCCGKNANSRYTNEMYKFEPAELPESNVDVSRDSLDPLDYKCSKLEVNQYRNPTSRGNSVMVMYQNCLWLIGGEEKRTIWQIAIERLMETSI